MKEKHDKTEESGSDDVVFESEEDSTPADQIKKLRERLKIALAEKEEYLAGWQRAKADLVNYKRETLRESDIRAQCAVEDTMEALLPVLDSFVLAQSHKETWEKVDQNWRQGIEYIHAELLRTLSDRGLALIDPPVGSPFNIAMHAGVENVHTDDVEKDGMIAEVVQKGYLLSDKVLRPARVKVFQYRE
ncbi:MAG: nucleotide exchange factor GrpE [Patescibacteria group bacterium]